MSTDGAFLRAAGCRREEERCRLAEADPNVLAQEALASLQPSKAWA